MIRLYNIMKQKKIAYMGLFAAIAIIFGYVESLIPFFAGIPGIKLGLANLAVLFILETYTWKEAALVSMVRILVIGFMFGNMFSILYRKYQPFLLCPCTPDFRSDHRYPHRYSHRRSNKKDSFLNRISQNKPRFSRSSNGFHSAKPGIFYCLVFLSDRFI